LRWLRKQASWLQSREELMSLESKQNQSACRSSLSSEEVKPSLLRTSLTGWDQSVLWGYSALLKNLLIQILNSCKNTFTVTCRILFHQIPVYHGPVK
jgi:hypothetical protein